MGLAVCYYSMEVRGHGEFGEGGGGAYSFAKTPLKAAQAPLAAASAIQEVLEIIGSRVLW